MAESKSGIMQVIKVRSAQKTHPTGDPSFSVMQAFPAGLTAEEADPFLMCDYIGPIVSKGRETNPDRFPVDWHPHRGMDILSYMIEGSGRHADSLGNREEFPSPGMQWISVGSGIEHAEGGGTPAGERRVGFQLWVNVPSKRKMDDPRYGTEPPENLPQLEGEGMTGRLLAGSIGEARGAFETVTDVQMVDYQLQPGAQLSHAVPAHMDNCLVYVYRGSGSIAGGTPLQEHQIARLDAENGGTRQVLLRASDAGMRVMLFAGVRLRQPIAWHGPFVMTTQKEIRETIREYRTGTFLRKRAPWDYKRLSAAPAHVQEAAAAAAASGDRCAGDITAADDQQLAATPLPSKAR